MRTALLTLVLLACGIGVSEASPPHIGTAARAERVVLKLSPGEVALAHSQQGFGVSSVIGVTAYVRGRELAVVTAAKRRVEMAGQGVYVVATVPRAGPGAPARFAIRAVALRRVWVSVYLEWQAG